MKPEEFKERRKKLELSLKDFGRLIERHYTQVHRWETGKCPVPKYAIICLERFETDYLCPTCKQIKK
tara:strand:- start:954 stop:1154 length:201 start_codon:yes stop_codon:yes gene_type:complete